MYVGDIIITGNDEQEVQSFISTLHAKFSLEFSGVINYFLGIEVIKLHNDNLLFNQRKYIRDLFIKTHMDNSKHIATPMITKYSL